MKNNCTAPDIVSYRTELMGLAALWIYIFHEWVPLAPNIPVLGFIEGFVKQIGFCHYHNNTLAGIHNLPGERLV